MTPERMNFGIFMAPFHRTGENPTLSLQRDLEIVSSLDYLGYDEAWIGEHHSGGWETIASPEVFIAAAGERTQRIRLGTGVVSVPYHHPFHVADRIVLVDHLTHGRAMLGVGPGALPGDAAMLTIEPTRQREMMDEGLGVIIRLMTEDEPINIEDGLLAWNNEYYVDTLGAPMRVHASSGREMAENLIKFGAFIGTPDDAIEGIQRLLDVSGGFGTVLGLAHDWANREKTLRSFE